MYMKKPGDLENAFLLSERFKNYSQLVENILDVPGVGYGDGDEPELASAKAICFQRISKLVADLRKGWRRQRRIRLSAQVKKRLMRK